MAVGYAGRGLRHRDTIAAHANARISVADARRIVVRDDPSTLVIDAQSPLKFLVVRRDNIGDLVCTTPVFRALRDRFPRACIHALVNSYNAAVLTHNSDVDEIHVYTKLKHRAPEQNAFAILWQRARLLLRLRRMKFDYAIVAGDGASAARALRFVRLARPRHTLVSNDFGTAAPAAAFSHEVEHVFRLLGALGIGPPAGATHVYPAAADQEEVERLLRARGWERHRRIGVHISARKPSNRWSAENFVQLIKLIFREQHTVFLLFWAPGPEHHPTHPGDDEKARAILAALADVPILGYPTHRLEQLIGGLAVCDQVICSDGGAMHLAAALGKPMLVFFGDSDAGRWGPWKTRHVLLQPASRDVADIRVADAFDAFKRLTDSQSTEHTVINRSGKI
jgi:ADP-heptose:LPS heptosyltransferase